MKSGFKISIGLTILATMLPALANATQGKYYMRADGAYTKSKITATDLNVKAGNTNKVDLSKTGKGYAGSVGLGYYVSNSFRLEGQAYYDGGVSAKNTTITQARQKTYAGFANGYVDVMATSVISPYIMGGVGYGKVKFSLDNINAKPETQFKAKSKSTFVWQAGLGVGLKASPEVTLDLGYRMMNNGSKKLVCNNSKNKQEKCEAKPASLIYGGARFDF